MEYLNIYFHILGIDVFRSAPPSRPSSAYSMEFEVKKEEKKLSADIMHILATY